MSKNLIYSLKIQESQIMTTIKRVQYPASCVESAKVIANNYFVNHKNNLDFLSKGFKAIPNLFSFSFPKEIVDKAMKHFNKVNENISEILTTYNTHFNAGTLHTDSSIIEKFGSVENFLEVVEAAKLDEKTYLDAVNPSLSSTFMIPFLLSFGGEEIYKKDNKVLLNPFTLNTGIVSDDGLVYYFTGTYQDFFEKASEIGFVYDHENCALSEFFTDLDIKLVDPDESVLSDMLVRDELAEFIRVDDDFAMQEFIDRNNIDTQQLFVDESLLSYCVEMDKPNCFVHLLFSSPSVIVNVNGQLDSAIKRCMFSVLYREQAFKKYLGKFLQVAKFDGLSQEVVDKFVKESFHDFRREESLDVFNLYKDKIDHKMLSLALVKHNNVYRMELPEMAEFIQQAFKTYPDDILKTENIVSHLEYYKETNNMITLLRNVPTIKIAGKNILFFLDAIKNELEEKLEAVKSEPESIDLINGKLATKVEHVQDALDVTNADIEFFSQYVERPVEEEYSDETQDDVLTA